MSGLVIANLLRRRGRTILSAVGVMIGVTMIVAQLALTGGLSKSAGDLTHLGRADFGVFQAGLADLSASSLPEAIVSHVRALPGVAAVSPIQIVAGAVDRDSSTLLFGSEPDSYLVKRLVMQSGHRAHGAEVLVGADAAQRLGVQVGQRLSIKGRSFTVSGIYRSGIKLEDDGVVLPLASTQRLTGRRGQISMIAVSIAPGYSEAELERRIQREVPGTLAIGEPSELARVDTNSRVIHYAAILIGVLAVLLGAVMVINTMALAVIERRGELGVLAALGWSHARVSCLLLSESLGISLAGTAAGLGLGALVSKVLVHLFAAGPFVSAQLTPSVFARGMLVGVALGVLGALSAMRQVLRMPLGQSLQQ